MAASSGYPAHWEADVLLTDGAPARVRPVHPEDVDLLIPFYERCSHQSKHLRFFGGHPRLTDDDVARFTMVDQQEHVSFIVTAGDEMIGIGGYDLLESGVAEVAFLVEDAHQGRGVGTLLLEHLAEAARERGVTRFVAEVLPENDTMVAAFRAAGYRLAAGFVEGLLRFEFALAPTETSVSVMRSREHRAEARSMERFFVARSVVVVGVSRDRRKLGRRVADNLVTGGYTGRVHLVGRGECILGLPVHDSVRDVPGPVDLAVIAVPAGAVHAVVLDCAAKGVGSLIVSTGDTTTGILTPALQNDLLATVRHHGMRLLGPSALGVIDTDPRHSLNATVAPTVPPPGRIGFFAQSGPLGTAILRDVAARGLGLSTFVSAGRRLDVSGNDLLQYWEDDPRTEVVLLYLESIGNARKFMRISRRVGRRKPVVAVKSGGATQGVPAGGGVRATIAPAAALDAMFAQAGVIQVDTLDDMLDCAQILAHQPLPLGPRIAVVGNSDAVQLLMVDQCLAQGLTVDVSVLLRPGASGTEYEGALDEAIASDAVDACVAVYMPPLAQQRDDVADALARVGRTGEKPLVAVFLGFEGVPAQLRAGDSEAAARGSVPSYPLPERAARALARAVRYSQWAHRPTTPVPEFDDVDPAAARRIVEQVLDTAPEGAELDDDQVSALLAAYGLALSPCVHVDSLDEAIAAGEGFGWGVVLKATEPGVRRHPYLDHVRRDIGGAEQMAAAWASLTTALAGREGCLVVQRSGAAGLSVTIRALEDPAFGPIVSLGVSGPASDLLGDVAFRSPPLTTADAADMVRGIKAAPLFFEYGGSPGLAVRRLEDVVHRVAQLKDALQEVADLHLGLLVGADSVHLTWAAARVLPAIALRIDSNTRRLPTPVSWDDTLPGGA